MSNIIAGDPAPTNPTARVELLDEYGRADTAPLGTLAEFRAKLDAYRAEVLAEAADNLRAATLLADDCACETFVRSQAAGGAR